MRVAIYTRVSTERQAEINFNSCEAQAAKIQSFIQSQENMELVGVYADPGATGATLDRPALNSEEIVLWHRNSREWCGAWAGAAASLGRSAFNSPQAGRVAAPRLGTA